VVAVWEEISDDLFMHKDIGGEWLVPFKGRNHSGWYEQNFLWRHGSVYVMDNHRAAAWCWFQHIDPNARHSLFHIDRHYDCLQSNLDDWLKHIPQPFGAMTINDYLALAYDPKGGSGRIPVIAWGNYLSIYLARFGKSISCCRFATHDDGDKPNVTSPMHVELWEIPGNLDYWLAADCKPWIVNIDLDYFFWHHSDDTGAPGIIVSDEYLKICFEILRAKISDGTVAVTTVCLTPESTFTGPWNQSERLAEKVLSFLGIEFRLP
jgi:hypothetical protein